MAANLFQLLASALGGGLQGYVHARQYQDALDLAKSRDATDKQRWQDQMDAGLAEHGILRGPTPSNPVVGDANTAIATGVNPFQVPRFQQVMPDHYMDRTLTPSYAKITEAQGKAKDAGDQDFKTLRLIQQSIGPTPDPMARTQLAFQNPQGFKAAFPDTTPDAPKAVDKVATDGTMWRYQGPSGWLNTGTGQQFATLPPGVKFKEPAGVNIGFRTDQFDLRNTLKQYTDTIKGMANVARIYGPFQQNLANARAGNPIAASNLNAELAQLTQPGTTRPPILIMKEMLGAGSIPQKFSNWINKGATGTPPPGWLDFVEQMGNSMLQGHMDTYDQAKAQAAALYKDAPPEIQKSLQRGLGGDVFAPYRNQGRAPAASAPAPTGGADPKAAATAEFLALPPEQQTPANRDRIAQKYGLVKQP